MPSFFQSSFTRWQQQLSLASHPVLRISFGVFLAGLDSRLDEDTTC